MLLIGSKAIALQCPDFPRPTKDIDVITTTQDCIRWLRLNHRWITGVRNRYPGKVTVLHSRLGQVEFELTESIPSAQYLMGITGHLPPSVDIGGLRFAVCPVYYLWVMKASHVHFPPHWQKTIEDYHWFKDKYPTFTPASYTSFYHIRQAEVKLRHPRLNQTNAAFFGQSDGYYPELKEPTHDYVIDFTMRIDDVNTEGKWKEYYYDRGMSADMVHG